MQPSWRGDTLSHDVPPKATWAPLLCGGANGLLTVILALAWWVQHASMSDDAASTSDEASGLLSVQAAIDEVNWALVQMKIALVSDETRNKKRKSPSVASPVSAKR
jgi:hypothetical protein